jgi:hypothetical protein
LISVIYHIDRRKDRNRMIILTWCRNRIWQNSIPFHDKNIWKSVNVKYHFNRTKEKPHRIISTSSEKVLDKI